MERRRADGPTAYIGHDLSVAGERQAALERFESAVEVPLLVLALAMVPLLVLPLLVELPSGVEATFYAADWLIWAAFAFEYVVRLLLTTRRWRFVRTEWASLLIIALPFLRPLRVVRSARAIRLFRLGRLVSFLNAVTLKANRILARHHLNYALLVTGVVVLGAAALALMVEEGHGGTIDTFSDALWWAVSTASTAGYGDTFPVTAAGRGIAAFLMIAGIALFGVLTANIAAYFVEQDQDTDLDRVVQKLDEILRRLDRIEERAE